MPDRKELGKLGENLAAIYLQEHGYHFIDRNYRTPFGEIDLILSFVERAQDWNSSPLKTIVFIEVKSRRTSSLGPPEISVTSNKLAHMRSAAEYYISEHPEHQVDWRIDVISVEIIHPDKEPVIHHFQNVTGI